MNDAAPLSLLQGLVIAAGVLIVVVGFVAWQARRERKEFSVLRVLGLTAAASLGSLPFVAGFWWLAPHDAERNWLLAAAFVPCFVLQVWSITYVIRRRRL